MMHKDWFEKGYNPKYGRIIDNPIYLGFNAGRILSRIQIGSENDDTIIPRAKRFKRFPYKYGFTGI